jgi:hypothetical protein
MGNWRGIFGQPPFFCPYALTKLFSFRVKTATGWRVKCDADHIIGAGKEPWVFSGEGSGKIGTTTWQ